MKNIIPITDLRNTVKIDQLVNKADEPIFVTKNGYSDLVIMSHDYYLNYFNFKKKNSVTINTFTQKEEDETFGFIKVKTVTIDVDPSNVEHNETLIKSEIDIAKNEDVKILLFQELTLTGSSIGDVFVYQPLLKKVENSIKKIKHYCKNIDMLIILGAPFKYENSIYNCAFSFFKGEILSITPKRIVTHPFTSLKENKIINFLDEDILFGQKTLLVNNYFSSLKIGVTFGDDMCSPYSNIGEMALNGASLICNMCANEELLENKNYLFDVSKNLSKINQLIIMTSNAGYGESTSDAVYSGHQFIFELGDEISSNEPFDTKKSLVVDIDVEKVIQNRFKNGFKNEINDDWSFIGFDLKIKNPQHLQRFYYKNPFLKDDKNISVDLCKYILNIQAYGLIKRLKTTRQRKVVLGLSGGLDSTLALLVAYEAFKILKYDSRDIICITMPAFGTTSQTKNNAHILAEKLGVTLREINISKSVLLHLEDIGHDLNVKDVAYENAQARERTQILMDIANKENALQLGTGDLSELCLGWCTYNGDQMSMYSLNSSIPKTMVQYLCKGYSYTNKELEGVLLDIIGTPISPELIPGQNDKISQKTEDIIGPYFLHDFIIYHFLNYGYSPKKLFFILKEVFKNDLSEEEILKWLKVFFRRFFQNQFKRTASPDGVKISKVSVSKKDLKLPGDISSQLFLNELDAI